MTEAPHFSLALSILANLPLPDATLLARELNLYSEAIRSRAGRTTFSPAETQTLFWRMYDVAKLLPEGVPPTVDLDELSKRISTPTPVSNGVKVRRLE